MALPPREPATDETLRRRFDVLGQAARALHAETDIDRQLSWASVAAKQLTGCSAAAACYLPRDGSPMWSEPARPATFSRVADPRMVNAFRPLFDAARPVRITDTTAGVAVAPLHTMLGLRAVLAVPVVGDDGSVYGALFTGSADTNAVGDDDELVMTALAAHVAVAIENRAALAHLAELEARGKEVVHQLQEAVRPPAPVVADTELGVHYVAADPSAPTGGDLYDWLVLPDGTLHLAIVDVMGKGVDATKHAVLVTHALRLLAVDGSPLAEMVRRADALVTAQNPDLVATLMVCRYDPDSGSLRIAGAGHPPALLVSNGEVREILAPGIPIGWPGAGSHEVVEVNLGRSDTLILYTDGLIEGTKNILAGLETLGRFAAETATYPATPLARALVERTLANASRHDDSLAVVLRRRTPIPNASPHALAPFAHRFSPNPASVPLARHLLRDWLELVPVEQGAIEELLLIASELCSNATRHASGAPGGIALRAWTEDDDVVIEVEDDGAGMKASVPHPDDVPDLEAEQGRGLYLIQMLADDLEVDAGEGGTRVRALKWNVVGSAPLTSAAAPD